MWGPFVSFQGDRRQSGSSAILVRNFPTGLRQVERQLAAIDAELRALRRADVDLKARLDILVSSPAIVEATLLTILIEMPEFGAIENKCAASLVGLAPIARDSGHHSSKRFIRAGRAHLRQALYMPALVAIRFNADMTAKYQALIAVGKPPKVAITAAMRKLTILANVLLREHRNWTPKATSSQRILKRSAADELARAVAAGGIFLDPAIAGLALGAL